MSVRAWQKSFYLKDIGNRIVHFLECDLACSAAGGMADIQYIPFQTQDTTRLMAIHSASLSQFGAQAPEHRSVLAILQGSEMPHFKERYPGYELPKFDGATIVSADAAEVAVITLGLRRGVIRIENKLLVVNQLTTNDNLLEKAVVDRLWKESRYIFYPSGRSDFRTNKPAPQTVDLIAPVHYEADYLSNQVQKFPSVAAFNAGYFIVIEEEFDDPFSFAFKPIGLVIAEGKVVNPPLFKRSALIFARDLHPRAEDNIKYDVKNLRPMICQVSLANYALLLPGSLAVHGQQYSPEKIAACFGVDTKSVTAVLNPDSSKSPEAAFYNRLYRFAETGNTVRYTPKSKDRIEFIVSCDRVWAVNDRGHTFIPQNGFVVSLLRSKLSESVLSTILNSKSVIVKQSIDLGLQAATPFYGTQVGVQLISQGVPTEYAEQIDSRSEEYVPLNVQTDERGVPPVLLSNAHAGAKNRTRIGFGITPDMRCYVVVIEGCEVRTFHPEFDSIGGSMDDLKNYLLELGCKEAIALDEGGSAQLVFKGRPMVRVTDRHDISLVPSERLIPGAWMIFQH
jgi:hypothetical protein